MWDEVNHALSIVTSLISFSLKVVIGSCQSDACGFFAWEGNVCEISILITTRLFFLHGQLNRMFYIKQKICVHTSWQIEDRERQNFFSFQNAKSISRKRISIIESAKLYIWNFKLFFFEKQKFSNLILK